MGVILGIFFHALGGSAAASFYVPFKKVKNWAWESYWLISGIAAWIFMPIIIGYLTTPHFFSVLLSSPHNSLFWCFAFGILWGIGGLTFGLSMRYLGMSLGYAVALGFSAALGTIIPPIYNGTFLKLFSTPGGAFVLAGVVVCLIGIAICGWAGTRKENELSSEDKISNIEEYNFRKGILVAFVSGVLSACMAFGIAAGHPIAKIAVKNGTDSLWQNNVVLVVILLGGFITNFLWCLVLNKKNKTFSDYFEGEPKVQRKNYFFSSLAGAIWYMQFFFYGMGTTKMGKYDFVSWTLHMSFIIVISNLWAIYLREWKGTSKLTKAVIMSGLVVIIFAIMLIGYGAKIQSS